MPFCWQRCFIVNLLVFTIELVKCAHFNGATISWKASTTTPNTATFFWKAGWVIGRGPCGATCDDTKLNTWGTSSNGYWKCYSGCSNPDEVLDDMSYWITSYNLGENWEQGEDSFTKTFTTDTNIIVAFRGGNWRSLNSVSATRWNIEANLDLRNRSDTGFPNNSPTTISKPVFRYQFTCDSVLKLPLVDPDGDRVKCRWATGSECDSVCNALPGAVLDEDTCQLTFSTDPNLGFVSNGWYAVALSIEDYPKETITVGTDTKTPNDVLSVVPLQFLVTSPSVGVSCNSTPVFLEPTPAADTTYQILPTETIILKVYAVNQVDPSIPITAFSVSAPTGLLRTSIRDDDLGRPNVKYIGMYFTPTEEQKGENIVCVMAEDFNGKNSEYRCFRLLAWDVDECLSNPCQNNGTCLNLEDRYTCTCQEGFGGTHCETDIQDSCLANNCTNNSTCRDGASDYWCECIPGYDGLNCERNFDECISAPCQNNGTCNNNLNRYDCQCVPGYNGTNCQYDMNECASSPCVHGNCLDLINKYECVCNLGWQGVNCQTDIDECLSSPCQNGGICLNNEAYYLCQCVPGYLGTYCEIDMNECASLPCQNGANCTDLVNEYQCQCVLGYSGTNCQTNIDECSSTPCLNGGNCIDLVDEYRCNCLNSWFGTHCEYNVDPCWSFPCLYGATCINMTTTYRCKCANGYMGSNCEYDYNECQSDPCPINATCINRINGYECVCPNGWYGDECDLPITAVPQMIIQDGYEGCACNSITDDEMFGCNFDVECTCTKGGISETTYSAAKECYRNIWPVAIAISGLLGLILGASIVGVYCLHSRKMMFDRNSISPASSTTSSAILMIPNENKYAKSASLSSSVNSGLVHRHISGSLRSNTGMEQLTDPSVFVTDNTDYNPKADGEVELSAETKAPHAQLGKISETIDNDADCGTDDKDKEKLENDEDGKFTKWTGSTPSLNAFIDAL